MDSLTTLTPLADIESRLARALAASPADETEIVWTESRLETTSSRPRRSNPERLHRTVAVRVLERGRFGSYRTGAGGPGELDDAVRQAMAQSRTRPPLPGVFHLPAPQETPRPLDSLHDPAIAALDAGAATELARSVAGKGELARVTWGEGRYVVRNSRGVARSASVTVLEMLVSCGRGAGAGRAEGASRTLAGLRTDVLVEEARSVHGSGDVLAPPAIAVPLVVSAPATGALLAELNRVAFTASAYREPASLVRDRRGELVFDPRLTVRDDATNPAGLPFPFDLEGTPKRPVDLVVEGVPLTPALDERQAAIVGLQPTGHAISGDDARAENLFVAPGTAPLDALVAAAEGGLWIGWLEGVTCVEPLSTRMRATARGVRHIRGGALAEPCPDLVWEDTLLRIFSSLPAIGRRVAVSGATLVGATVAPRLVVGAGGAFGVAAPLV